MSDELKKQKRKFWIRLSFLAIILIVVLILFLIGGKVNQKTPPTLIEIDEVVRASEANTYDINTIPISGGFQGNKEDLAYEIDRIVRHLESVYMSKAPIKDKESLLRDIVTDMKYPFCANKPRIFLSFKDNRSGRFSSYDEILDIILTRVKKQYFGVRVDMDKERKTDCIQALYFYVKEYDEE